MGKKLFSFTIEEDNGEQEYSHTEYVWAKDFEEAQNLAWEYSANFYDEGFEIEKYMWTITGIQWRLEEIKECEFIYIGPINGQPIHIYLDALNFEEKE